MTRRRSSIRHAALLLAVAASPVLAPCDPGHLADAYQLNLEFDDASTSGTAPTMLLVPRSDEAEAMLRDAQRATSEGRADDAMALYERAAQDAPEQAVPALARFLSLTDRADDLKALADRAAGADSGWSPLVRARVLAEANRRHDALEVLLAGETTRNGADAAAVKLAARILREEKRDEERELLLIGAIAKAPDSRRKSLYWNELLAGTSNTLFSQPSLLLQAMAQGLEAAGTSRAALLEKLDDAVIRFQHSPDYFKVRQETLDTATEHGAGAVWFATRMLVREERHDEALAYLTEREPSMRVSRLWPVLAAERAELLRQTGRLDEFRDAIETLAKADTPEAAALRVEAARAALSAGNNARALENVDAVDPAKLAPEVRRDWMLARMLALAREGDVARIVAVYPETVDGSREEDVELFEHAIFSTMIETAQHAEIEKRVRAIFHENPDASPTLWRLAARAAVESRRKPNELEALYRYALARPKDTAALDRLAASVGPIAAELAQAPKEVLAIPQEDVDNTIHLAAEVLREVARRKPLDPEAFRLLLELRAAQGRAAEGVAEVVEIGRASNNPKAMANIAFVLATNGHPAEALPLYDEILAAEPGEMAVRMNRAACLTRLDRWDEAVAFYRDVLLKGHEGRPWHEHELVQRLWQIAKHRGQERDCIDWFRDVASQPKDERSLSRIENMAAQLANDGRFSDAEWFLNEVMARTAEPSARARTWSRLIRGRIEGGDASGALELFARADADLAAAPESRVDLRLQHAEFLSMQGRPTEAVDMMLAASREFPDDAYAADALHRAGQLMEQNGDPRRAAELYHAFLASTSRNFDRRKDAESRLAELEPNS